MFTARLININFFSEDVNFSPDNEEKLRKWLYLSAHREGREIRELNYIFCSDSFLFQLNQTYLKHDTLTDVITFDNSDGKLLIEGDVYISIERIKENAVSYSDGKFLEELYRVMIHGFLHLVGFFDDTEDEKKQMRAKEDEYLKMIIH